jgi:hypothetical protein
MHQVWPEPVIHVASVVLDIDGAPNLVETMKVMENHRDGLVESTFVKERFIMGRDVRIGATLFSVGVHLVRSQEYIGG